jgi:hypothetical protein
MWIDQLNSSKAKSIFGEHGEIILSLTRSCARGLHMEVPSTIAPSIPIADVVKNFGPNGVAVYLFLEAWNDIPWRSQEGRPLSNGENAIQVSSWKDALNPTKSRAWAGALFAAGFRSSDETLQSVWAYAGKIGASVGGHHAAILAGATAGELAQIDKDLHFFLDLMPWIWMGHWPCGWHDDRSVPLIL